MNKLLLGLAIILSLSVAFAQKTSSSSAQLTAAQIQSIKDKYAALEAQKLTDAQIQLALIKFAKDNKIDGDQLIQVIKQIKQAEQDKAAADEKAKKAADEKAKTAADILAKVAADEKAKEAANKKNSSTKASAGSSSTSGAGLTSTTGQKAASP